MTTAGQPAGGEQASLLALVGRVAEATAGLGRQDLEQRLRIAIARVVRPATVVCVVGEFKQGKSSLVNALLGQGVCPVDDDIATSANTFVRYADRPQVLVHRRVEGKPVVEEVPPSSLPDFVTEGGNPENARQVERVEIGLPNPLLADGLVLVDMPGVGGLGAGLAASTLAFLPFADGLVFVSDATSELSAPERSFLGDAAARCPTVLMALTKIDIAGDWRRIAALDRGHLDAMGDEGARVEVLPVSATLRRAALRAVDRDLDASSGYPAFTARLRDRVVAPAKQHAAARARADAESVLDQLMPALTQELDLLEHPERVERALADLAAAQGQLEHLRGPGARWSILVNDRMSDISSEASYRFRGSMRSVGRTFDSSIDEIKTPAEWEELGSRLQAEVAAAVGDVFTEIERGIADLRVQVAKALRDEGGVEVTAGAAARVDVAQLWAGATIDEGGNVAGRIAGQGVTGLRGAQSGLMLFSLVAGLMPQGAAVLLLASPLTLGIGVAFAGHQLMDANRRKIAVRRQKAKIAVRQFLDDVQFEVTNQLAETIRTRQRDVRDEFTERVTEALRTNADLARRAKEDAERAIAERDQRLAQVRGTVEKLAGLRAALAASGVAT
jgi:hypothetical protein